MKTVTVAVALVASTISASACGLIANLVNPDCRPAEVLMAEDTARCKQMKHPVQTCVPYLQQERLQRIMTQQQVLNAAADAMKGFGDAYQRRTMTCSQIGTMTYCNY